MPKPNNDLTAAFVRKILFYDPATGVFTWRVRVSHNTRAGDVAGYTKPGNHGYFVITVKNKVRLAHRLAWLYMTGKHPKHMIDHVDSDKTNNKWENLREATHAQNNCNSKVRAKSGAKGVQQHYNKWTAKITVDSRPRYLGLFETKELAAAAYAAAAKKYHGEFARIE
jgi:hypothetical protein